MKNKDKITYNAQLLTSKTLKRYDKILKKDTKCIRKFKMNLY